MLLKILFKKDFNNTYYFDVQIVSSLASENPSSGLNSYDHATIVFDSLLPFWHENVFYTHLVNILDRRCLAIVAP